MGIAIDVVQFTLNTGTGTQDITGSLGGLTPKAALFFVTRATANGSAAADAAMSVGAATGASNEWVIQGNAEDGQATTDTHTVSAAASILLTTPGTNTVEVQAEFSAWITNGVRINVTTAGSAFLGTCVLFAGSDLSAHANNVNLGDTLNLETNITAPGFEPDIVFASIGGELISLGDQSSTWEQSVGIVENGASIVQRTHIVRWNNGSASGDPVAHIRNDAGCGRLFSAGGLDWRGEFANFDASGFSVISRNGGANDAQFCYLALALGGVASFSLDTEASPTSTGNNATTNPGFTPQVVVGVQSYLQSFNSADGSADAGAWGISAFTGSTELCVSVADENAAGTTNTQSYTDTDAIDVPNDDGTVALEASFVSMDANGYTLNWIDVEAAARQGFFVAIEQITVVNVPAAPSKNRILDWFKTPILRM